MRFAYLISEDFIKTNSQISENIWEKDIVSAIRYTQDIDLAEFIGEKLYMKIVDLVLNDEIDAPENDKYKTLLDDYIQDFLVNRTIVTLMPLLATKITNKGVIKTYDENIQNISKSEIDLLLTTYQTKANNYARRLQKYLSNNCSSYPELECSKAHLKDAFDNPISLGGARGKRIRR